jgi:nuclear pore complex protein Nup54
MSFGNFGNTERRTGTLFGSTTAPPGGLFNTSQNAPAQSSLFGSTATQSNTGGIFGAPQLQQQNQGSTLFGTSQQQPQPQAQQQMNNSIMGGFLQPAPQLDPHQSTSLHQSQSALPQLRQNASSHFSSTLVSGQSMFTVVFFNASLTHMTGEKSILEQMGVLHNKWDPTSADCAFRNWFYNTVDLDKVPFYGPQANEPEREWEDALSKKPNPGAIPVLARGFEEIASRIQFQNLAVSGLQTRLHEINNCLAVIKDQHELQFASRIAEAKRKHIVFTKRTLALAAKVQILRNRGYAMDQAEEELKKKLLELHKKSFDPVLGGRQEEIWARMSGVRERARILQEETDRLGRAVESQQNGEVLSAEDQKQVDKVGLRSL